MSSLPAWSTDMRASGATDPSRRPLYSPLERERRDATAWTLVQGILAPLQFLVFLVSLGLVLRYLTTGSGYGAATASVVGPSSPETTFTILVMVRSLSPGLTRSGE